MEESVGLGAALGLTLTLNVAYQLNRLSFNPAGTSCQWVEFQIYLVGHMVSQQLSAFETPIDGSWSADD